LVLAVGGAIILLLAYRAFRMLGGIGETGATSYGLMSSGPDAPASTNLTDVVKNALTPDAMHKVSSAVGESSTNTRKALEAMVPTILAGLASQASTSSGASRLFEMAKESVEGGGNVINNLASHLTGGGMEQIERAGGSILNAIFGDKVSGLLSYFTRFAGIKTTAASALMSLAGTLVMNVLGKQILQHGLNPSSLGSLLSGQMGWLSRLLPHGITDVPGMSAFADFGERAGATARGAAAYGERAAAGAREAAREGYQTTVRAGQQVLPWASALLPLALLSLPFLAFPFVIRSCSPEIPVAKGPDTKVPDVTIPNAKVSEIQPAAFELPGVNPVKIKLPDGVDLTFPETKYLNGVYKFLSDATDTKPRAFVFENLTFDGATVKTTPETETSIKVMTALLKAFPGVEIRIEGYTDNVGDPDTNRRISRERANAVKDLLVKAGVPAERVTTAGFGPDKPIAPNDSEENRAKNRRIEVTFVKK
jgi:outer membrane protein OmpA-like peptidoglycan-associated protein